MFIIDMLSIFINQENNSIEIHKLSANEKFEYLFF